MLNYRMNLQEDVVQEIGLFRIPPQAYSKTLVLSLLLELDKSLARPTNLGLDYSLYNQPNLQGPAVKHKIKQVNGHNR